MTLYSSLNANLCPCWITLHFLKFIQLLARPQADLQGPGKAHWQTNTFKMIEHCWLNDVNARMHKNKSAEKMAYSLGVREQLFTLLRGVQGLTGFPLCEEAPRPPYLPPPNEQSQVLCEVKLQSNFLRVRDLCLKCSRLQSKVWKSRILFLLGFWLSANQQILMTTIKIWDWIGCSVARTVTLAYSKSISMVAAVKFIMI